MGEVKRVKLINYRSVECCPNCLYCDEVGVDEEVLECKLSFDTVSHDAICDFYEGVGV
jgi:hypothetical protein